MKKTLALFLCLLTVFLTACGNEQTNINSNVSNEETSSTNISSDIGDESTISNLQSNQTSNIENPALNSQNNNQNNTNSNNTSKNNTSKNSTSNNKNNTSNTSIKVSTDSITPFGKATGTVTTKKVTYATEHFNFEIPANVYLVENFYNKVEEVLKIIEKVSGLEFKGNSSFPKIKFVVSKDTNPGASKECELGPAFAVGFGREIQVSPGDLFLGKGYTIVHELSHVLQYDNCNKSFQKTLCEGFAEYTTYKVLKYLEANNTELLMQLSSTGALVNNMSIENMNALYAKPITHWMKNEFPFEYASNTNYTIGVRLLYYFDKKFGNYTAWLKEYKNRYINPNSNMDSGDIDMDKQIQCVKDAYGASSLDGFYSWLKANGSFWNAPINDTLNLSSWKQYRYYPNFYYDGYDSGLLADGPYFKYNNLTVSFVEYRHYMKVYKKKNISKISLENEKRVTIALYDANGKFLRASNDYKIPLTNVYYIKLVGSGTAYLKVLI